MPDSLQISMGGGVADAGCDYLTLTDIADSMQRVGHSCSRPLSQLNRWCAVSPSFASYSVAVSVEVVRVVGGVDLELIADVVAVKVASTAAAAGPTSVLLAAVEPDPDRVNLPEIPTATPTTHSINQGLPLADGLGLSVGLSPGCFGSRNARIEPGELALLLSLGSSDARIELGKLTFLRRRFFCFGGRDTCVEIGELLLLEFDEIQVRRFYGRRVRGNEHERVRNATFDEVFFASAVLLDQLERARSMLRDCGFKFGDRRIKLIGLLRQLRCWYGSGSLGDVGNYGRSNGADVVRLTRAPGGQTKPRSQQSRAERSDNLGSDGLRRLHLRDITDLRSDAEPSCGPTGKRAAVGRFGVAYGAAKPGGSRATRR